ncbi:MAG: hypothetical protein IIA85_01710 [Nanoarchaeota archaeon]|nr:hypothetical protein [Nanoarchaeota archaeon]
MKWSPILHMVAFISGVAGVLALIGAWIATANGSFLGLSEGDFFNNATTLLLVSIAFGIGTLIHHYEEERE